MIKRWKMRKKNDWFLWKVEILSFLWAYVLHHYLLFVICFSSLPSKEIFLWKKIKNKIIFYYILQLIFQTFTQVNHFSYHIPSFYQISQREIFFTRNTAFFFIYIQVIQGYIESLTLREKKGRELEFNEHEASHFVNWTS